MPLISGLAVPTGVVIEPFPCVFFKGESAFSAGSFVAELRAGGEFSFAISDENRAERPGSTTQDGEIGCGVPGVSPDDFSVADGGALEFGA